MSQQVAGDLRAARDLISKGWCQGSSALTLTGNPIGPKCPNAAAWCAGGAISAVTDGRATAVRCAEALCRAVNWLSIPLWNDMPGRTKEQVLGAFSGAIAAQETAE